MAAVGLAGSPAAFSEDGAGVSTFITTQEALDGGLLVQAGLTSQIAATGSLELVIARQGQSGTINSKQVSAFEVSAGESVAGDQVRLSFDEGDVLTISLTATRDGMVLDQTILNLPETPDNF